MQFRTPHVCALALACASLVPIGAQAAPLTCAAGVPVPPVLRSQGKTEPLADLLITCTGGVPTPAGSPVPQINITIFLNTNATSLGTAHNAAVQFDEALLLVDEPNSLATIPQHPLLNCGQSGAPDSGPSGPGVCEIVSNGIPAQTYDGTSCPPGATVLYGCGRPNAFQGRLGLPASNVITFRGVPFDPPGAGTRTLRFTNLRANAEIIGAGTVDAFIAISSGFFIPLANPFQIVGFITNGLFASIPGLNQVRVTEGFAEALKDRNVSFAVGNPYTLVPGNATPPPPWWIYSPPSINYPDEVAQNVPGTFYHAEDQFQWQTLNANNGPPLPVNPPPGFGIGPVANLGLPLNSAGLGGLNTGISGAGVASQGTRIALSFSGVPSSATVVCTPVVNLFHAPPPPSGTATGVMFLTKTDANGAGPYTPMLAPGLSNTNLAVYEVLYADPFALEFGDIQCHLSGGSATSVQVTVSFAPFYGPGSSDRTTPTAADPAPTAIPRFANGTITLTLPIGPG